MKMVIQFQEIIKSTQFTFVVGPEKTRVSVHSAAIAAQSPALDALINGRMLEAQTGSAEIEDVESEDFIRFCEFAYRGDYTTPPCDVSEDRAEEPKSEKSADAVSSSQEPGHPSAPAPPDYPEPSAVADFLPAESAPADDDIWPVWDTSKKAKDKKKDHYYAEPPKPEKKTAILRKSFSAKCFCPDGLPSKPILSGCDPVPNTSSNQDFTNVFLAHARLYTFAEKYLIEPLKQLTLHKLHKTLVSFRLYESRVGDVLELARYAYSDNTRSVRTDEEETDGLRKLVVEYMGYEIDTFNKSKQFNDLLEDGGEFVRDLWRIVGKYLL